MAFLVKMSDISKRGPYSRKVKHRIPGQQASLLTAQLRYIFFLFCTERKAI